MVVVLVPSRLLVRLYSCTLARVNCPSSSMYMSVTASGTSLKRYCRLYTCIYTCTKSTPFARQRAGRRRWM